jgi:hypothetical protein
MQGEQFADHYPTLAAYGLTEKTAITTIEWLKAVNANPSPPSLPTQYDEEAGKPVDSSQEIPESLSV